MNDNYTWRELKPGDFFQDINTKWYGLKISNHRYFNFLVNKAFGVNHDFFDVRIFRKAHCELVTDCKQGELNND